MAIDDTTAQHLDWNHGEKQSVFSRIFTRSNFYGVSLFLLVAFIIVQVRYGASASMESRDELANAVAEGAGGDRLRQLFYFAIFFLIGWITLSKYRPLAFMPISIPYNLACGWCLISFIWAIDPMISLRRAVGMYIILIAVAWCIQELGAAKTIRVLYTLLATLILSSLISVALSGMSIFSFAVHPADEIDAALVGAWKGVFLHKNVAGAVMVHSSIFFFHHVLNRGRKIDWLFFFLSLTFLYFTKSKTSLGWCFLVLMSGYAFRFMAIRGASIVFAAMFLTTVLFAGVLAMADWDHVVEYLTTPTNLSGRVGIWLSVLPFIENNPWLGSGYGSFWAIGFTSPIFQLAIEDYIAAVGHSHSGYVEVLLTTGSIGFGLAALSLIILPFYRFMTASLADARLAAMLFSIWLFGILQNFTESQFFSPDKQSWIFVVIAIIAMHNRYVAHRKGDSRWLRMSAWPQESPAGRI
jgi:exopolysaccharide production protein ExoQ